MIKAVFLDSGPLGVACNAKDPPESLACRQWLADLDAAGVTVYVPEIADYETRRELVRAALLPSVALLDALNAALAYLPLTTPALRRAADLWAQVRNAGQPTAPDLALDGDVILAGQVLSCGLPPADVVVATSNPKHIRRFVAAEGWRNITP